MRASNEIFYYPYANLTDAQVPLLKAVALNFDKIYILDPEKANSGSIGIGNVASDIDFIKLSGEGG